MKINYENTKRPHYFAFLDERTGLYWLVPCSSKIEKFERLIRKKQEQHKPTDVIRIEKIMLAELQERATGNNQGEIYRLVTMERNSNRFGSYS